MPSLPSIQLLSAAATNASTNTTTTTTTMVTTGSGSNRATVDTQQMLLPGHVAVLHVTTCGQSGAGLGSDEKEIVLLIYVIINVQANNIIGVKQYLVRPSNSTFRTESSGSNALGALSSSLTGSNSNISNSSSSTTGAGGCPTGINASSTAVGTSDSTAIAVPTGGSTSPGIAVAPSPPECAITQEIPAIESLVQTNGRPLEEVIQQFDEYTKSLNLDPHCPSFRLVTDGQLPLRQCLHPEASAKDVDLPQYYWRFCDLRKEFVRFRAGDLSRALVPVAEASKLQSMPSLPPTPASVADIIKDLDLQACQDNNEFYVKEARDMVTIVKHLITLGHKFEANEIINLNLEPGICSIDDEIDGTCIVRARGLPWQSSDQDIAKFFRGLNVAKGGVALCLSPQGRRNGEALVRFVSQEHRDMALKRHKHHIGNRYIEVYRANGEDFLAVAGGASNEAQAFLSKGAQVIIRMRGLPYDCTAKQVLDFFANGENSCNVLDGADGILFVKKPDGRATGDAFVLFEQDTDASKALSKHRESIGQRYIELFRSTTAEVQQVLNRSMDPKTYEPPQPPLIAQLPQVQMQLLPQHVITSGIEKNCIRLRGLPYEAKVEHILHFLDDFANHIVYQGVHLVYNAQGQFNGEAFIQMDSETAAYQSAQQKHHKNMMFGKKQRYIEVFQCSGDDMNMVLNGGFQQPASLSKPSLLSPGMLPTAATQPPTQSPQTLSLSQIPLPIPSPLALSVPPPNHQLLAQQQAQYIAQHNLLARQAAAAQHQQQQQEQLMLQNLGMYVAGPPTSVATSLSVSQPGSGVAGAPTYVTAGSGGLPPSVTGAANAGGLAFGHGSAAGLAGLSAATAASGASAAGGLPPHLAGGHPAGPLAAQYQPLYFMHRQMLASNGGIPMGLMGPQHTATAAHHAAAFNQFHHFGGGLGHAGATAPGAGSSLSHHASAAAGLVHHPSSQHHAMQAMAAAAASQSAAAGMLPSKRSYDSAFRGDQSTLAASAGSKRPFHGNPSQGAAAAAAAAAASVALYGGTIVGAPFGGYAPFGHPPSAVLPPPRHAAFYPQPILYWGYPSPPVSPTTYYSTAPPGTPHHLGPAAHQTAGIPAHSHAQPTMLALSPDQRNQPRNNPSVSLVTVPPRAAGTAGSSSGESSTSQSSSPPLLSPTGGCSSSGSVTSVSSGTSQRHGTTATIRTSPPPPQPPSASLLSLPLAAATSSQPLAIPAVTTPTGGLAGAYPGSQLSPIQAIPPPSVHFPHAAPLMGTASPPGTTGTTYYEPHPHLPHHPPHHHPHHHHHHHHHHPHHPLTHHHHDKLVATAPSILTPSLIPNQYVELFIV